MVARQQGSFYPKQPLFRSSPPLCLFPAGGIELFRGSFFIPSVCQGNFTVPYGG